MELAGPEPSAEGEARRFGEVLEAVVGRKRCRERASYGRLVQAWEQVAGREVARLTRILGYSAGTVAVEVSSPVLLQELEGFLKPLLLQQLRSTEGSRDVVSLEFRLGRPEKP